MTGHPDFDGELDQAVARPGVLHIDDGARRSLCGREGLLGNALIDERDLSYSAVAMATCLRCLRVLNEQLEEAA